MMTKQVTYDKVTNEELTDTPSEGPEKVDTENDKKSG